MYICMYVSKKVMYLPDIKCHLDSAQQSLNKSSVLERWGHKYKDFLGYVNGRNGCKVHGP